MLQVFLSLAVCLTVCFLSSSLYSTHQARVWDDLESSISRQASQSVSQLVLVWVEEMAAYGPCEYECDNEAPVKKGRGT